MTYPELHHLGFKLAVVYFLYANLSIASAKLQVSMEKAQTLKMIEAQLKIKYANDPEKQAQLNRLK